MLLQMLSKRLCGCEEMKPHVHFAHGSLVDYDIFMSIKRNLKFQKTQSSAHRALRRARRPPRQQPVHRHRVGPAQVPPWLRLGARGGRNTVIGSRPPASVFGLKKVL